MGDQPTCSGCHEQLRRRRVTVAAFDQHATKYDHGNPSGGEEVIVYGGTFCSTSCAHVFLEDRVVAETEAKEDGHG